MFVTLPDNLLIRFLFGVFMKEITAPSQFRAQIQQTDNISSLTPDKSAKGCEVLSLPQTTANNIFNTVTTASSNGLDPMDNLLIGALCIRMCKLCPAAQTAIEAACGFSLSIPQDEKVLTLADMVSGANGHVTEEESHRLLGAIFKLSAENQLQPAAEEPFAESEIEKLSQLKEMFIKDIESLASQAKAEEKDEAPDKSFAEPLQKAWEQDLAMLNEFNTKGKSEKHLKLDMAWLQKAASDSSPKCNAATEKAAGALRGLCQKLVERGPVTDNQKNGMMNTIVTLSGLAAALQKADGLLSTIGEYKKNNGTVPSLPNGLEETINELRSASGKVNFFTLWRSVAGEENWDAKLHSALSGCFGVLEEACSATVKALKEERPTYKNNVQQEQARLTAEAKDLSSLAKTANSPLISKASSGAAEICQLVNQLCTNTDGDLKNEMKKTAGALVALSQALQNTDAIMPTINDMLELEVGKEEAAPVAKQLEKMREDIKRALESLKKRNDRFGFIQLVESPKANIQDLTDKIDKLDNESLSPLLAKTKDVLGKLGTPISLWHTLEKKTEKVIIPADKAVTAAVTGLARFAGTLWRTGYSGLHHGAHAVGQKFSPESYEKQVYNAQIRTATYGPLGAILELSRMAEDLSVAAFDAAQPDVAPVRASGTGIATKIKKDQAPVATTAERQAEKLKTLITAQKNIESTLAQVTVQVEQAGKELLRVEERYPEQFSKIQALRKELGKQKTVCQEAVKKMTAVVRGLAAPAGSKAAPVPASFEIAFGHLCKEMTTVQQAVKQAEVGWKTLPESAQVALSATEPALQTAAAALKKAVGILNDKRPDSIGFLAEVAALQHALRTPALSTDLARLGNPDAKKMAEALSQALQHLEATGKHTERWEGAEKKDAKLNPEHLLTKEDFKDVGMTVTGIFGDISAAMGTIEANISRLTGKRFDMYSNNMKVIRHTAQTLADLTKELPLDELAPASRKAFEEDIDQTIHAIAQHFRKPNDAMGNAFALRLKKEYQRACKGEMLTTESTEKALSKGPDWLNKQVKKGGRDLRAQAGNYAAKAVLGGSLPTVLQLGVPVWQVLKSVYGGVKNGFAEHQGSQRVGATVTPGHALPEYVVESLRNNFWGAVAKGVIKPWIPTGGKMAISALEAGFEAWRDGFDTMLKNGTKGFASDAATTIGTYGVTYGGRQAIKDIMTRAAAIASAPSGVQRQHNTNYSSTRGTGPIAMAQTSAEEMRSGRKNRVSQEGTTQFSKVRRNDLPGDTLTYDNAKTRLTNLNRIAYPVETDVLQNTRSLLQKKLDVLYPDGVNGQRVTPDTTINCNVIKDGQAVPTQISIMDLATGAHIRANEGAVFGIFPAQDGLTKLNSWFKEPGLSIFGYPFPITKEIETNLEENWTKLNTSEAIAARKELTGINIMAQLLQLLDAENTPAEVRNAINELLKGNVKPQMMQLGEYTLNGVYAIPLASGENLVIRSDGECMLLNPTELADPAAAERAKAWLKSAFPLEALLKYENNPLRSKWVTTTKESGGGSPVLYDKHTVSYSEPPAGTRGTTTFVPAYNLVPVEPDSGDTNSLKALAGNMAQVELDTLHKDQDTFIYSSGEYYTSVGIDALKIALAAATPIAMKFGSKALQIVLTLLNSGPAGAGLDLLKASTLDDPNARTKERTMAILALMMSTPGDVLDIKDLATQAKQGLKKLNNVIKKGSNPNVDAPINRADIDQPRKKGGGNESSNTMNNQVNSNYQWEVGKSVKQDGVKVVDVNTIGDTPFYRLRAEGDNVPAKHAVYGSHGITMQGSRVDMPADGSTWGFMVPNDHYMMDPGWEVQLSGNIKPYVEFTGGQPKTNPIRNLETNQPHGVDDPSPRAGPNYYTHGINEKNPQPNEVADIRYDPYEDQPEEIAKSLATEKGKPATTKSDIILPKEATTLGEFVQAHKDGKLVNSAGQPYESIDLSHCRNYANERGLLDGLPTKEYYFIPEESRDAAAKHLKKGGQISFLYQDEGKMVRGKYRLFRKLVGYAFVGGKKGTSDEPLTLPKEKVKFFDPGTKVARLGTSSSGYTIKVHGESLADIHRNLYAKIGVSLKDFMASVRSLNTNLPTNMYEKLPPHKALDIPSYAME